MNHWYVWLPMLMAWAVLVNLFRDLLSYARRRQWLICRQVFGLWFVALPVGDLGASVLMALTDGGNLWVGTVRWFLVFNFYDFFMLALVKMIIRTAKVQVPTPIMHPYRNAWHEWRTHRDHDVDCKYGPKRRYGKAPAKLTWTKISLRPGVLAPT